MKKLMIPVLCAMAVSLLASALEIAWHLGWESGFEERCQLTAESGQK